MKRHIVSAIITFVASFLTAFSTLIIAVPTESWTSAGFHGLIAGALLAAVRAALKPAFEKFLVS